MMSNDYDDYSDEEVLSYEPEEYDDYFEDQDDAADYVFGDDEEDRYEEESKPIFKPRQLPKVVPPEPTPPPKVVVKLPLFWLEKPLPKVEFDDVNENFPDLGANDGEWIEVRRKPVKKRKTSPSFKRVKNVKAAPNIRLVVNPEAKYCLNVRERATFGYAPYAIHWLPGKKEQSRMMCKQAVRQKACSDARCMLEHDVHQWCAMDKTRRYCGKVCTFAHFYTTKGDKPMMVRMCKNTVAGKPCVDNVLCEYEHDVSRWCNADRQGKRCRNQACNLAHPDMPKLPSYLTLCSYRERCKFENCSRPHNAEQRFYGAQACSANINCNVKGCFRRHTNDTVDTFSARLAL